MNRLTLAREERARRSLPLIDLTLSNPTRAALPYPHDELGTALARGALASYDPHPLGLPSARETVARTYGVEPEDVVITASTSEAYSFLFKLLTDSGDEAVTAVPSYPLLDHLAQLEQIRLATFPLEFHRRWEITPAAVQRAITARTRAIVVVSPNNPTGSYASDSEIAMLQSHGLPLIVDEVFREYRLDPARPNPASYATEALTFRLGGLSKSAGLPHFKLGWIILSGPAEAKRRAIAALELIADNYLSTATPVQEALPELLAIGARIRAAILERIRRNYASLKEIAKQTPSCSSMDVEGGWSAVLRVPRMKGDEDLALHLLERGVLVQPGYFFDFDSDGYLVISLLTPPQDFEKGVTLITREMP